ncbi:hypothetical protein [Mycobacterium sp. 050134]|uniref:PPW family C-terminal domain-containing PPE protein n=1 Tax=Mycobacterium sp. 050134 TaxID=3096111 RepID=UPI002ED953B6
MRGPESFDLGAGPLGFAGATAKSGAGRPAGFMTLAGSFGGPAIPRAPSGWGHHTAD